mmetsp:Transcript_116783/g.363638  ORF Transcript_116783/g.363638 Transcript_116783/m.363638 type:complete len:203 (-) Transcript_116783:740-1348(-)
MWPHAAVEAPFRPSQNARRGRAPTPAAGRSLLLGIQRGLHRIAPRVGQVLRAERARQRAADRHRGLGPPPRLLQPLPAGHDREAEEAEGHQANDDGPLAAGREDGHGGRRPPAQEEEPHGGEEEGEGPPGDGAQQRDGRDGKGVREPAPRRILAWQLPDEVRGDEHCQDPEVQQPRHQLHGTQLSRVDKEAQAEDRERQPQE